MKKPETVIVLNPGGKGGIAHYSYCLAEALAQRGVKVTLITEADYELSNLPHDSEVVLLPLRRVSGIVSLVKTLVARRGSRAIFQVSNNHTVLELLVAAVLSLLETNTTLTVHNALPRKYSRRKYPFIYLKYLIANSIVVLNRQVGEAVTQSFRLKAAKTQTVFHGDHNFLRVSYTKTMERGRRPSASFPRLLFFGAVSQHKGIDLLLSALALVVKRYPTARLTVAGKCQEDPSVYAPQIGQLSLEDHVTFRNEFVPLEAIEPTFLDADILCLPYRTASESAVAHTGLAFDIPIVATRTGGLIGLHERGLIDELAAPDDPADFAEKVIALADDLAKGVARQRPPDYTWREVAEDYARLIGLA